MSSLTISRRYARALFQLSKDGLNIAGGLAALAEVSSLEDVRAFLAMPGVSAEKKATALEKAAGIDSPELGRLLVMLCERDKAELLPEINELFLDMVREDAAEVAATVTTAVPLSAALQKKISTALAEASGHKVNLEAVADATILGGVVIKIGDRQIDRSVRGRLDGLRKALV